MTNVKLFDTFCRYQMYLNEKFPGIKPKRMDVTQPFNDGNIAAAYAHLKWACEEGKKFVEQRRFEKAMRWLGFIQGCLFARGHFTIDEMGNHSRPPEPPFTTNYVSEVMHSCALKMEQIANEETEARQNCSHITEYGQSALRAADPLGSITCAICQRTTTAPCSACNAAIGTLAGGACGIGGIACPQCGLLFCDNCYNTNKGDGCACHAGQGSA